MSAVRSARSQRKKELESEALTSRNDRRDLSAYARAYGASARRLLESILVPAQEASREFVANFYDNLRQGRESAEVLERLEDDELQHLQERQAAHFAMLLSPRLTVCEHFERAARLGRVHDMVGVGTPSLLAAYHSYQRQVFAILPRSGLPASRQDAVAGVLMQRILLDVEAQTISQHEVAREVTAFAHHLNDVIRDASTMTDLMQEIVRLLGTLEGVAGCVMTRPDAEGTLQVEVAEGPAAREYVAAMQSGQIPLARTSDATGAGQGPSGRAWRSKQIELCNSYRKDPTLAPWRDIGMKLGFRSSACVPLLDEDGQPFALLVLYSRWPGFFSTAPRQDLLASVQNSLSKAVLDLERGPAIPLRQRQDYQRQLRAGGLQMLYQPIIDLRDGSLRYAEALARLHVGDRLASPAVFLPAFGKSDLLELFRLGLVQVCRDIRSWTEHGLAPAVSVNLPADALAQDAYQDTLFETLAKEGVAPERIRLEILETQELRSLERHDERIAELRRRGIHIVQDDLGSGHSSLLRMDRIPFDGVKIDQGFVRNATQHPQRALEFILHLTRLVSGIGIPVTVEGLEDRALIEAAAILGADQGQGYGIAEPMAARALPSWRAQFIYDVDPRQPRTPLGALAAYLLWDQERNALGNWPDLIEFTNEFPCLVDRYIDGHGLHDSELDRLYRENRRAALLGNANPAFRRTRQELIACLTRQIQTPVS